MFPLKYCLLKCERLLVDPAIMNDFQRKIVYSEENLVRLTVLTNAYKMLPDPQSWT